MLKGISSVLLFASLLLTASWLALAADAPPAKEQAQPALTEPARAIFAGGCFWCMESPFEKIPGVREVISGYTAGSQLNPTYQEVAAGGTGHTEAVEVQFDPAQISYAELLDVFWRQIDPTDANGQFVDRGTQYRSGIYPLDSEQRRLAEESKQQLAASGRFSQPIVTEIVTAGKFYPAEEYHQDYYQKNPIRYQYYRYGSGRDRFLDRVWGAERK